MAAKKPKYTFFTCHGCGLFIMAPLKNKNAPFGKPECPQCKSANNVKYQEEK